MPNSSAPRPEEVRLPQDFLEAVVSHARIHQPEPGRFVLQMNLVLPGLRRLEVESLGSKRIKLKVRGERKEIDRELLASLVREFEERGLVVLEVLDEGNGESA